MTRKEQVKNNILISMKMHLDSNTFSILESVLVKEFYNIEISDMETLPATNEMSNEYIWELYDTMKGSKLSKQTIDMYKLTLFELLQYTGKSILHLEQNDVEYYLGQKQKEGNKPVTLNNKIRFLCTVFNWLRKRQIISANPAECIEPYTEIEKPIDHLEPYEVEQLKKGCKHKRDRALMEWLRCTATRGGEMPIININQIDWQTGKITIYGQKGHAYRPVCLDNIAIGYIREYLDERGETITSNNPLFTHLHNTKPLQRGGICTSLKAIARRAGVQHNVYTHLFRKTVATQIVRRGGSDSDAGEYLGHKPMGVTGRHYIYRSEDRVVKIFDNFVKAV